MGLLPTWARSRTATLQEGGGVAEAPVLLGATVPQRAGLSSPASWRMSKAGSVRHHWAASEIILTRCPDLDVSSLNIWNAEYSMKACLALLRNIISLDVCTSAALDMSFLIWVLARYIAEKALRKCFVRMIDKNNQSSFQGCEPAAPSTTMASLD